MPKSGAGVDAFLSYNSRDSFGLPDVEAVAKGLQARGVSVFFAPWYLKPGTAWVATLEERLNDCGAVVVCVGAEGLGNWQLREVQLALDRQAREREKDLPIIPVLLPNLPKESEPLGFIRLLHWVDLRGPAEREFQYNALAKAIRREKLDARQKRLCRAAVSSVCPYRGLSPFREEDAPFFFGRESDSRHLVEAVRANSITALIGASGSGKSSVLQAGLASALRADKETIWEIVNVGVSARRPGPAGRPFKALASSLTPFLEPLQQETGASERNARTPVGKMTDGQRQEEVYRWEKILREQKDGLGDLAGWVLDRQPGTDRLLLVVDAWEELYTLSSKQAQKQEVDNFIDALLNAIEINPLKVVLALRADFYDSLLLHRALSDRIGAVVNLAAMNCEELEQVVLGPARKAGIGIETALVDSLVEEAGQEPGSLPLLQFVLRELWEESKEAQGEDIGTPDSRLQLSYESYKRRGRLRGALSAYAEKTLEDLPRHLREVGQDRKLLFSKGQAGPAHESLKDILLALVQVRESGVSGSRRRAHLSEFPSDAEPALRYLEKKRLLVIGRDEEKHEEFVELAHESLIYGWERMAKWVKDERSFLLWRSRMDDALKEWEERGRSGEALLRGYRLREAEQWRRERPKDLSDEQTQLIDESLARELLRTERIELAQSKPPLLLGAVGCCLLSLIVVILLPLEWLDRRGYDILLSHRPPQEIDPRLLVLGIDEDALADSAWPWSRSRHADLIEKLNDWGAQAAVFAIRFFNETEADADQAMAAAIRNSRIPILLASDRRLVPSAAVDQVFETLPFQKFLDAGADHGFVGFEPDPDDVIRRTSLSFRGQPDLIARLAAAAAKSDIGGTDSGKINSSDLPTPSWQDKETVLVNYVGPPGTMTFLPLSWLEQFSGDIDGRIVLVGLTVPSDHQHADRHLTPWGQMPAVEIQANVLNTLLTRNFIRIPSWLELLPLLVGLCGLFCLYSVRIERFWLQATAFLGSTIVFSILAIVCFLQWNVWLLVFQPVAAMLLYFVLNASFQALAWRRIRRRMLDLEAQLRV